MDNDLKNRLWNALNVVYLEKIQGEISGLYIREPIDRLFIAKIWDFLKKPIDEIDSYYWYKTHDLLHDYFFGFRWFEVYDFIEFIANMHYDKEIDQDFMKKCNSILENEQSAYRFVGGLITQITSKEEISEIEEALSTPFTPVYTHLSTALTLLSRRESPDYRNSIKESISAVESLCNLITGKQNTPLGQCLRKIEEKIPVHGALKEAFRSLYGYTSSAEGIRHALLDEATLESEDAKFMLVSCSAFINYLKVKSSKAGITF